MPGNIVIINGTGFSGFNAISALIIGGVSMDVTKLPGTDSVGDLWVAVVVPQLSVGDHEVIVTVAGISADTGLTVTEAG